MHKEKVSEMKRLLVFYVRGLMDIRTTNIQTPVVPVVPNTPKIQMSSDGYPHLPTETNFSQWKKADLTDAMRTFLNAHYSKTMASKKCKPVHLYNMIELASGSKRSVPFKAIQHDNDRYIERKYLPPQVIIKEVKNMHRADVIKFMEHVRTRQINYGYQDAFRFAIYIKKQKEYPSLYSGDRPPTRSKATTNPRKKKTKRIVRRQVSPPLNVDEVGDGNTNMEIDLEQRAVENHGTPAGTTPTPMANDKGKGKAVEPEDVSDIIRSRDLDSTGCPSDELISVPAAGVQSTFGTADATCNEASTSKNTSPSQDNSGHRVPTDCPSDASIREPAAEIQQSTVGPAGASCKEVSNFNTILPSQNTRSKKSTEPLKQGSPKKKSRVGRSDALALEEAKKLLCTPRKRRR